MNACLEDENFPVRQFRIVAVYLMSSVYIHIHVIYVTGLANFGPILFDVDRCRRLLSSLSKCLRARIDDNRKVKGGG